MDYLPTKVLNAGEGKHFEDLFSKTSPNLFEDCLIGSELELSISFAVLLSILGKPIVPFIQSGVEISNRYLFKKSNIRFNVKL